MKQSLDEAKYWKLRAVCTDTQRAQDAYVAAQKRQMALLAELNFKTDANFSLNDDALEITFPDIEDNGK